MLKLHWLQHVEFEDLGHIEEWAFARDVKVSCTKLYKNEALPSAMDFDLLVVMGGPMGIYDHEEHPWLIEEKQFIRQAIDAGKRVLGICLGAQLIADVLGARVYPGLQKEIGWFPIRTTEHAPTCLPEELTVFHWHGDTFDIPAGAERIATSAACVNQGFIYQNRVIALQFHMEITPKSLDSMIRHCREELTDAPFIQSAEQMYAGHPHLLTINPLIEQLINSLTKDPYD